MSTELQKLIVQAQNGQDHATLDILERFKPLLKKYSWKLTYDDAMQDLPITFLTIILHMESNLLNANDGQLTNYIVKSIYHEYIKLSKKNNLLSDNEIGYDDSIGEDIEESQDYFKNEDLNEGLKQLTAPQKAIIYFHYFEGYSIQEVATRLGISRQAANKTKNTALKALQKILLNI